MEFEPLISEIEIDGVKLRVSDICNLLRKNGKETEDFLLWVVERFGQNSIEFIFVIQGMIFRLINLYLRLNDDREGINDLVMEIINAVLRKMKEYDRGKGKLVSFIHTIIRGEITKWSSKENIKRKIFMDIEEQHNLGKIIPEQKWKLADTIYLRARLWDQMREELMAW